MQIFRNPLADRSVRYAEAQLAVVSQEQSIRAEKFLRACPLHAETPLRDFTQLARRLDVAQVFVKDESARLGLSSFKALGGAYAVMLRVPRSPLDHAACGVLRDPSVAASRVDAEGRRIFATATDGNHGISVAAGAWLTGSVAVCFLPRHVERVYEETMRRLGARVVRVDGTYDVAVAEAAAAAKQNGWTIISDTTEESFDAVTRDVLAGYGVMVNECTSQLAAAGNLYGRSALTHVFIQGGVGGLAAAFAGGLWQLLGDKRPTLVIVEPRSADCLYQTALHGEVRSSSGDLNTSMGMLSCGRPSRMAWTILRSAADHFVTIEDPDAEQGVGAYAHELAALGRSTTPSGAAGLGGLIQVASNPDARAAVGLTKDSVVLTVCSESRPARAAIDALMAQGRQTVQA